MDDLHDLKHLDSCESAYSQIGFLAFHYLLLGNGVQGLICSLVSWAVDGIGVHLIDIRREVRPGQESLAHPPVPSDRSIKHHGQLLLQKEYEDKNSRWLHNCLKSKVARFNNFPYVCLPGMLGQLLKAIISDAGHVWNENTVCMFVLRLSVNIWSQKWTLHNLSSVLTGKALLLGNFRSYCQGRRTPQLLGRRRKKKKSR